MAAGSEVTTVSAIVLVGGKYEPGLLKKCLASLSWVNEIVQVKTEKFKGSFSDWRNEGAKRARGDWLFYVDSDETVSPALQTEIKVKVAERKSENDAFAIPRRNILLGHEMRWGGWWPDYVVRLIKKDTLLGWEGELHEQPKIKGKIGKLHNSLIHVSHRYLVEMVAKTNQ